MSKGQKEQIEALRGYVHRALTNKAKGLDATSYANLVKELGTLRKKAERDPGELTTLHLLSNMVTALRDCVSALRDRKHDALLNEVLGIKLWSCHQTVREAVLDFIANLVVANAAFTHTCLQLLVYSFLPPPGPPKPAADTDQGSWSMPEDAGMVQAAVLATLVKVLQMVPTAPTKLLQLITHHFPHKLRDRDTQCMYLSAMLSLAEARAGAPIRDGLLAAAVEHLLSIDVEIRWEDIVGVPTGQEAEEGASESEDDQEDIFELEGMSELDINATPEDILRQQKQAAADRGGWEGAKPHKAVVSTSGRPAVDETATKLDSLMELMFEHLARRHASGHTSDLWLSLLSIFERTILHTHRSKFTQYLVFYVCSKQPQPCAAAFVDLLLTRLHDARQPANTRAACAAYTASFLARAAFAPPDLVLTALQRLVFISRDYAASCGDAPPSAAAVPPPGAAGLQRSASNPALTPEASFSGSFFEAPNHQVFYASIQSVLYILCYQLRTLMGATGSGPNGTTRFSTAPEAQLCAAATRHLVQAQLLPLLNHWLAPLRVCLPSVAAEFTHQAVGLGLLDAASLSTATAAGQRPQRPLEMFFPFDPYLLKRSSRHLNLKQSYVRWQRGQPTAHQTTAIAHAAPEAAAGHDSDDSDNGSDDEGEEDDEGQEGMSASAEEDSSDDDELGGMSVPSDSVLSRPGLPATRSLPPGAKPPAGMLLPPSMLGLHGNGLHGGGFRGKASSTGDHDMGVSFSPGHIGSFGGARDEVMPSGTSPVLVNYISPAGASPMQMTPIMHTGMEAAAARLGRR